MNSEWLELKTDLLGNERQTISLEEAINHGLKQNPALALAYAQLETAEWTGAAIKREWNPTVVINNPNPDAIGYSSSNTLITTNRSGNPNKSGEMKNRYALSPRLQLSWTFFDPTRGARIKANDSEIESRRYLFDASARNVVLNIQSAYYTLQTNMQILDDYGKIYRQTQNNTARALRLFQQGKCKQTDLNQLRSQQYKQLTRLIQQNEQASNAAYKLASALSLQPGHLALPDKSQTTTEAWPYSLQESIDNALSSREEIQSLLALANRQRWISKSQLRRYLPVISALAQSFYQSDSYSKGVTHAANIENTSTESFNNNVGFTLNWKLFDGGTSTASSHAADQDAVAWEQKAQLERLAITQQVQESYAAYKTSLLETKSTRLEVVQAKDVLNSNSRSFSCAKGEVTTLIQNTQALVNAISADYSSIRKHNISIASLYRFTSLWPDAAKKQPIRQTKGYPDQQRPEP